MHFLRRVWAHPPYDLRLRDLLKRGGGGGTHGAWGRFRQVRQELVDAGRLAVVRGPRGAKIYYDPERAGAGAARDAYDRVQSQAGPTRSGVVTANRQEFVPF